MSSIRISQLDAFSVIKTEDFVPLVDSSSLTTYRVTLTSFNTWFADSGSCHSASWASASKHSDAATSASWASSSVSSSTTSHLMYPNTSTASYAMNSLSSSWALRAYTASLTNGTASWANIANSSSYANTSSVAITASYFNFTTGPSSIPPFADACTSASWASASISASRAITASYAISSSWATTASYVQSTAGGGASPIAWANFVVKATNYSSNTPATVTTGNSVNKPQILNSYNVSDVSWCKYNIASTASWDTFGLNLTEAPRGNFLVTLANPSSNLSYCVVGTLFECDANYNYDTDFGILSFFTAGARTSTKFTASFMGGDWNSSAQMVVFNMVVYA